MFLTNQKIGLLQTDLADKLAHFLEPNLVNQYCETWATGVRQIIDEPNSSNSPAANVLKYTFGLSARYKLPKDANNSVHDFLRQNLASLVENKENYFNDTKTEAEMADDETTNSANASFDIGSDDRAPKHYVIRAFFLRVAALFDKSVGKKHEFRRMLLKRLPNFGLNWKTQSDFDDWIRSNSPKMDFSDITDQSLSAILDECYEEICSELGPVLADKIISNAAQSTEALKESQAYSIKQIL